jgi:hypothetical protein
MKPFTTLAVLATAACCAAPGPAVAASGTFEVGLLPDGSIPQLVGPLPAGDAVAFAAGEAGSGWSVRLGAPGAVARELRAIAPERGTTLVLAASATHLAVARHAEYCDDCRYTSYVATRDELQVGALGRPLATLAQCVRGSCEQIGCVVGRQRFGAVLGAGLLATRDECGRTWSLTNLATGATRSLGNPVAVAVAGTFVAVAETATPGAPATIVVRDAATGAEDYRAGPPAAGGPPQILVGSPPPLLALRADGAVVYTTVVGGRLALVAASSALPGGRVLRELTYVNAIAGLGDAGVVLLTGSHVEVLPLDGSRPTATLDISDPVGPPATSDGRTVTWSRRTCTTAAITSWRIGEPVPAAADLRCPTPVPARTALRLPRHGRLAISFTCPATARGGCRATAYLTARRLGKLPRDANGATRVYRLGRADIALDPGATARRTVTLAPGAQRWVRRHAPLRMRIDVVSSRTRSAQRPAGDDGTISRTVALRATH